MTGRDGVCRKCYGNDHSVLQLCHDLQLSTGRIFRLVNAGVSGRHPDGSGVLNVHPPKRTTSVCALLRKGWEHVLAGSMVEFFLSVRRERFQTGG
jgi:hypothetical protein